MCSTGNLQNCWATKATSGPRKISPCSAAVPAHFNLRIQVHLGFVSLTHCELFHTIFIPSFTSLAYALLFYTCLLANLFCLFVTSLFGKVSHSIIIELLPLLLFLPVLIFFLIILLFAFPLELLQYPQFPWGENEVAKVKIPNSWIRDLIVTFFWRGTQKRMQHATGK